MAIKIGCAAEALRRRVSRADPNQERGTGLTTDLLELLEQLLRENRELPRANEILRAAQVNARPQT